MQFLGVYIREAHALDGILPERQSGTWLMGTSERGLFVETPLKRFLTDFFASKLAIAGLVGLALVVLIAIFAPWIAPQNPYDLRQLDIMDGRLPPGSKSFSGSVGHWPGR